LSLRPRDFAVQNNALQTLAARGRLGIPVTVSTDPRSHFKATTGASTAAAGFSQWPETLGLAAIGDLDLVRRFADIVRQEYRAIGIHMALSPQADLATSPRWPRIEGTFGEDPKVVRQMVGAYVEGIQGGRAGLNPEGVAAVVKHWVGYGASRDGFDGHNYYGRFSAFPGGAFQDHVDAFLDAFEVKVSGVMPTYNILQNVQIDGEDLAPLGAGFSRPLLINLLRGDHEFEGVILSDWAITKDCNEACRTGVPVQTLDDIGMSWGVDHLSAEARFAIGVDAGLDQFGGENDPAPLLAALDQGLIDPARLDISAYRILKQKFELGLFDAPFVDVAQAEALVGCEAFLRQAEATQRRALTWLERTPEADLKPGDAVFVHGLDTETLTRRGFRVVTDPGEARIALLRMSAPYQTLHPDFFFGSRQHEGDLDFKPGHAGLDWREALPDGLPVIVSVHLDRPAILTQVRARASGLLAEFGASEDALLDVLTGLAQAEGRLPFALPASMAQVLAQTPDRPLDNPAPLYPVNYCAIVG